MQYKILKLFPFSQVAIAVNATLIPHYSNAKKCHHAKILQDSNRVAHYHLSSYSCFKFKRPFFLLNILIKVFGQRHAPPPLPLINSVKGSSCLVCLLIGVHRCRFA